MLKSNKSALRKKNPLRRKYISKHKRYILAARKVYWMQFYRDTLERYHVSERMPPALRDYYYESRNKRISKAINALKLIDRLNALE